MSEFRGLAIDSCGADARLVLFDEAAVRAEAPVVGRGFSAQWPRALRELMGKVGWEVRELQVVGVVHGPGSFTGVRVGLAAAKGLCEATGARMIAVSRLEVLQQAVEGAEMAVLAAGRGEFYVRERDVECLVTEEALREAVRGKMVAVGEGELSGGIEARRVSGAEEQSAAIAMMRERWRQGRFADVERVDANYVRGEGDIYAKKAAGA